MLHHEQTLVLLISIRMPCAFWRTKDALKVILIATVGSTNVVLKISRIILINDSSFQCYFGRME